ncbi:DDE-type integrase/transposase/recombinase, partial [Bacillus cereus]|uniref:DDE-type integrase/transposase/recombinase n=1 Tax=Bacillus cereus TaxID=1396 RepID=UPI0005B39860
YTTQYTTSCKKYLNNIIEQDHRSIKKRIRNMLGLKALQTATKMIAGIEAMHMVKKGQTLQGARQRFLLFGAT